MHPYQMSELTYLTAREISGSVLQEGTALGTHSTTTLQDTYREDDADYWNTGTIWITAAGGVAPEWESAIIRDYAADGTFTIDEITVAPSSGDEYAACKRRYPLWLLKQAVNHAVNRLGPVPREDTSLTTIEAQTEYALPLGANPDLRQVWLQTNKDDSNDNKYVEIPNWDTIHGVPGTGDTLAFDRQFAAGYQIRLVYMARHAKLDADTDALQEDIPIERIIYPAALFSLKWYRDRTRTNDFKEAIRELQERVADDAVTYQVPQPIKPAKALFLNDIGAW